MLDNPSDEAGRAPADGKIIIFSGCDVYDVYQPFLRQPIWKRHLTDDTEI